MLRFILRHTTAVGDRDLAAYTTCDADVPELERKLGGGTRIGDVTERSVLVSVLAVEILPEEKPNE